MPAVRRARQPGGTGPPVLDMQVKVCGHGLCAHTGYPGPCGLCVVCTVGT